MDQLIHPVFQDCGNCIVFCADNNFMALTAVAIQSILESRNPAEKYDIVILHSGINEEHITQYDKMFGGYDLFSVRCVNISKIIEGKNFYTGNKRDLSQAAYYRLMIPWVVDDSYHHALYLDGDMIVRHDIAPLFQTDIEGRMIAAVRDYWGICNCYIPGDSLRAYREGIGLQDIDDYVISATVLFDLVKIRKEYNAESVLALCESRQWRQHDQDVLNVLFYRRIKLLSPSWGYVTDYGNNKFLPQLLQDELTEVEKDPNVSHFAAGRKPYLVFYRPFDNEFWIYALHTPYFGELLARCRTIEHKWYALGCVKPELSNEASPYFGTVKKNIQECRIDPAYGRITIFRIEKQCLQMEGRVVLDNTNPDALLNVHVFINETEIEDRHYPMNIEINRAEEIFFRGEYFLADYPLDPGTASYKITIRAETDDGTFAVSTIDFGNYCPFTRQLKNCYYSSEGWFSLGHEDCVTIEKSNAGLLRRQRALLAFELLADNNIAAKKALLIRPLARNLKKLKRKQIWLISDRILRADDNGEAFFRFVVQNHSDQVKAYFLISRNSPDYERMKEYGSVIPIKSYRHKILALMADWSISSQTDQLLRQPFEGQRDYYADMLNHLRFCFLQHGVFQTDLTRWLGRAKQHLDGFVVSTYDENNALLNGQYHYDKEVWLTGLSRFDYLENKQAEKIVTVMPTWRKNLAVSQDTDTGFWNLKPLFEESEYAAFFRDLMSHPRLKEAAEKYGYSLQFKVHPSFGDKVKSFGFAPDVKTVPSEVSYREIYSTSSLIVTDYSSSVSDFVYLRKPVIYTQFDIDTFFEGHISERGDLDYERKGFGEVEYTLESTVDRIIEYMENGCQLKPLYRERIDAFFAFHDRNNCMRLWNKIMSQDKS